MDMGKFEQEFADGIRLKNLSQNAETLAIFENLLLHDSKCLNLWLVLGRIHWIEERYSYALACFRCAISVDSDSEIASLSLFHLL